MVLINNTSSLLTTWSTALQTNASSSTNYSSAEISLVLKVIMGVIVALSIIPGILGNILVIIAITTTNLSNYIINLLVLSLAVTDILISAFPLPVLSVYFVFYWPSWMLGKAWCQATVYVVNLCGLVSILSMTIIAVDRYFAVQRNRSLLTRKKCYILLVIVWVFGALVGVTSIINGGTHKERLSTGIYEVCNHISGKQVVESSTRLSLIIKLLLGFPVILGLVLIYVRLSYSVWKRRHAPTAEHRKSKNVRRSTNHKIRALHMMFAVVVTFAFCWIPYYLVTFFRVVQVTSSPNIPPGAVLACYCLAMLNSTLNPIVYALLSKRFRTAFQSILTGRKRRRIKSFASDFRDRSTKL